MKMLVSATNAWAGVVISVFAVVILTVIGNMFRNGNHALMGHTEDPDPSHQAGIAGSIFTAVFVYIGIFVFCGLQALMHLRQSKRGAIALS